MANTNNQNRWLDKSLLAQRDISCIWHPFTQVQTAPTPIPIIKGEGAYLFDEEGHRYLDAISSWWVNLHGHAHPYIARKISEQAFNLEHVIFADFTHQKAIDLAERLLKVVPGKMSKVFYTDNGSTAVEVALKMAIQFWHNQNSSTKKIKVVSFKHGYHGDTFGAMSASGRQELNNPFWRHLFESVTLDPPKAGYEDISYLQMKKILKKGECACFIFEPLVQGSGGMRLHSSTGLDALLQLCKQNEVITIADEVMTGFGRTGRLFACELLKHQPDIICLSKGLSGGFLPLGATLCKAHIFQKFLSNHTSKALLHGHSYTANPLACAAALASLDLLETQTCTLQRQAIHASHLQFACYLKMHPKFVRVEVIGTLLILEYKSSEPSSYFNSLRDRLYNFFLSKKILLRPLGNVVYVLPPYCIEMQDLNCIYQAILETLEKKQWK